MTLTSRKENGNPQCFAAAKLFGALKVVEHKYIL